MEPKRRDRALVQTEMVEFIALPFAFPNKLKIWSFRVIVVQGLQSNVQKSVMHVQNFVLLIKAIAFFDVPFAVFVVVS